MLCLREDHLNCAVFNSSSPCRRNSLQCGALHCLSQVHTDVCCRGASRPCYRHSIHACISHGTFDYVKTSSGAGVHHAVVPSGRSPPELYCVTYKGNLDTAFQLALSDDCVSTQQKKKTEKARSKNRQLAIKCARFPDPQNDRAAWAPNFVPRAVGESLLLPARRRWVPRATLFAQIFVEGVGGAMPFALRPALREMPVA